MAPVLLCPECGTKHPLDNVAGRLGVPVQRMRANAEGARAGPRAVGRARAGCGRRRAPLPVAPPSAPAAPAPAAAAVRTAGCALGAGVLGPGGSRRRSGRGSSRAAARSAPGDSRARLRRHAARRRSSRPQNPRVWVPPAWVRFLLWIVAVPLAFLVVFGLAKAFGMLTTNEITDVALAEGWGRFWPIIRLLPFVALATALFVTGGVYGIAPLPRQEAGQGRQRGPSAEAARRINRRGRSYSPRSREGATRRCRSRRDSARCGSAAASGSRA